MTGINGGVYDVAREGAIPALFAGLPTAGNAGRQRYVSNAGTKGSVWVDDGTRWKPLNGFAVLASLDAPSADIGNTETVVFQYQMPSTNLWAVGDIMRLVLGVSKSGTTDTGIVIIRAGTAGTTGDTSLYNSTVFVAAQQTAGLDLYFRRENLTATGSVQLLGRSDLGYGGSSSAALQAAANVAVGFTWINVSLRSGGTTNTVKLTSAQVHLLSKAT